MQRNLVLLVDLSAAAVIVRDLPCHFARRECLRAIDAAAGKPGVTATRRCRVSVTTGDGVTHVAEVQGTSVFEAAAAGVARMRDEGWTGPLAPNAVIRVEVQPAPIVHDVPLKALQRWAGGPSVSPKQELLKQPLRRA